MLVIKNEKIRRLLNMLLPFLLILTVVLGALLPGSQSFAWTALVLTVLALLLFITGFERKKTGTRRLILSAVMIGLSVAGRFIPIIKPVTAITVIAAVYLGAETGFLVGSMSALISNFYFGHGPWTPFQMLSWGTIGFVAGLLGRRLKKKQWALLLYGAVAGILFSLLMDTWTVLWYDQGLDWKMYLASVVASLPHMLLYCVSNVIFLKLFARPFGEKLERVKLKYGV